jgi:hypothetical protein
MSAGYIGWHIINHEHGKVGTAEEVASGDAKCDAEVVTTFLKAIVGAMRAVFPQSTVMIYNEGHWWGDDAHFDEVPSKRRIGDVPNCSGYPGTIGKFREIVNRSLNMHHGLAYGLAYPWLWMSQFNVWAGGNRWWFGRERYEWHEKHLVNYMRFVGKHLRETDRIGGCVIHRPLITDPMHVRGLAALVGGINDDN